MECTSGFCCRIICECDVGCCGIKSHLCSNDAISPPPNSKRSEKDDQLDQPIEVDNITETPPLQYEADDSPFTAIEWTAERGFPPDADRFTTYPRRAAGAGSHMGLTVLMNVHVRDYYCSTTNSAGFKVLMHPPTETPKIADYGFAIAPGRESRVVITPTLADASLAIRDIPVQQRQCIFADEGNLTYYRWVFGE